MPDFDIVVSAENNRYMQWQAMMFHYNCKRVVGKPPIIVVHMDDEPLMKGFQFIEQDGGIIQRGPTYRHVSGIEYPPRNTACALQHCQTSAPYVVLCDADMVFINPPALDDLPLSGDTITFDRTHYLDPDESKYQAEITHACRVGGIDPNILRNPKIDGGVPHVIPTERKQELSHQWLRHIELFPVIDHPPEPTLPKYAYPKGPHLPWLSTMWAVIMAMHQLGMKPIETAWCLNNYDDAKKIAERDANHCMIHYCYDGSGFNKRDFKWDVPVDSPEFWSGNRADDTVGGFLRGQFLETAQYFGISKA